MEAQEREALTDKSNALRVELKIWEKEFAFANDGKKASRDDIKKNPEIGTSPPLHSIYKSSC
jgi:DNA replication regulator SLD2